MVSAVGRDELGTQAMEELQKRGVISDTVAINEFPTGSVRITLDENGKADYLFALNTSWDNLTWTDKIEKLALRTDAVAYGTLGQRSLQSRECIERFIEATASNCLRIFDVNLRQEFFSMELVKNSLKRANILKLNDEELEVLFPNSGSADLCNRLQSIRSEYCLDLVALTRGAEGAILVAQQETSECGGFTTEVKDTVGAGDAFTAVLARGILTGATLDQINRCACRTAAFVCSRNGATPQLPKELRESLEPV